MGWIKEEIDLEEIDSFRAKLNKTRPADRRFTVLMGDNPIAEISEFQLRSEYMSFALEYGEMNSCPVCRNYAWKNLDIEAELMSGVSTRNFHTSQGILYTVCVVCLLAVKCQRLEKKIEDLERTKQ